MVHTYPGFDKVAEIKDAHDSRVLFSCVGPEGDLVVTGAGDENLKFWRIWEVPKASVKKDGSRSGGKGLSSVSSDGIRSIR
jgi:cell division cycle protein 20 (cofactor of APC complex)